MPAQTGDIDYLLQLLLRTTMQARYSRAILFFSVSFFSLLLSFSPLWLSSTPTLLNPALVWSVHLLYLAFPSISFAVTELALCGGHNE
ncbi:hypothetical protein V8C34DRAFT_83052 [Trichoderma compactum]